MESMTTLNDKTKSGLELLARYNRVSAKGYDKAGEQIDDPLATSIFRELAVERRGNATAIEGILGLNGEVADDDDALLGKLHRWWMELKGTITEDAVEAMLDEVARGEAALDAIYEETLVKITGNPLNSMLHEQLRRLKESRKRIARLQELAKAS